MSEADTCRKFVVPKLQEAGWDTEPHSIAEQRTITDGRIVPVGSGFVRKPPKRVDYLLRYTRDFPLAVVEAKPSYKTPTDGLQQAKLYAEMLGLRFAYATNGREIIEFDYFTGLEKPVSGYPSPSELWDRYRRAQDLQDQHVADQLLTPFNHEVGKGERYFQQIAVNRTVEAILKGKRRLLLTMATGTGKSQVKGWEGAIAACDPALAGWYVSPEYRTFRCVDGEARPRYMAALVRSEWFWRKLAEATRGVGARRERTRPEQFLSLQLPMPDVEHQEFSERILARVEAVEPLQAETAAELDALLPAILDRAFKGEL